MSFNLQPLKRFWQSYGTIRSLATSASDVHWAPPPKNAKVWVGLSGGVDSSVSARLLVEAGFDVKPYYMRNWDTLDEVSGSGGCEWEKDWDDVQRICRESLGGVKPDLLDLSSKYWQDVFQPALESWQLGETPNPDVTCNSEIKFKALPDVLLARDPTAWLATGHYARLMPSPITSSIPALHRSTYPLKDQSYYLSTSPVGALSRTIFPLGDFASKEEVRKLARKWNLHTSEKRDSMGICFVGVRKNFSDFIDGYILPSPGNIELESGKIVGKHGGLWRYTIGEGARVGGLKERMFIGRKVLERNAVIIVPGE
ncbi:hypothetical protein P7C70_g6501, partial [Phenoliferia sp. Uapishka_3]